MRPLVSHVRYTELLSRRILRTATPADLDDIKRFEAAQPANCPRCNARVHSFAMPEQIVHDIANCPGKPAAGP